MSDQDDPRVGLNRITAALVDDLCALSDDELRAEIAADSENADAIAREVDAVFTKACLQVGKQRFSAAQAAARAYRGGTNQSNVANLSAENKKRVLSLFAANDGTLRERLTMAARSGEAATEREIDSILTDLLELGAIDAEGNPT